MFLPSNLKPYNCVQKKQKKNTKKQKKTKERYDYQIEMKLETL